MRKQLAALAALSALALPASAQAAVTIGYGTPEAIPDNNDFGPGPGMTNQLFSLFGLVNFAEDVTFSLDADHVISFEFLGSESGYDDTFSAPNGISWTETSSPPGENHFLSPIYLGAAAFASGSNLAGLLNFTTSGSTPPGRDASVGQPGFAIFLPEGFDGTVDIGESFFLGYDDQLDLAGDDNHDDFIVKATVWGPVPEPSTWLLMILGFGAIGFGLRQRKQVERIRFDFA